MGRDLLVAGGEVFAGGGLRREDVRIRDGAIAEVGVDLPARGERVLDARGMWVLPGGIDNHVHFREPGAEDKEGFHSGSRGALAGGATTVLEVQNCQPLLLDAAAVEAKRDLVSRKCLVHFGFYGNLLPASLEHLGEMAPLLAGFKLFMGGSTGMEGFTDYAVVRGLLAGAAATGLATVLHCEEETLVRAGTRRAEALTARDHGRVARPAVAEALSVAAAVELALDTGAAVHVFHLSTARGLALVRAGRLAGADVSASTCPHYLYFRQEDADRLGNLLRVNPAIHAAADRDALRQGLASGEVEVFSTDHAPHRREEKDLPYANAPSGIPSVDLFYPLLLTLVQEGVLDLARAVESVSEAPARIHRLARKGRIAPGMDGDLAVVDPSRRRTVGPDCLFSRSGFSPYEGMALQGWPRWTVVAGHVAFDASGPVFHEEERGRHVCSEGPP